MEDASESQAKVMRQQASCGRHGYADQEGMKVERKCFAAPAFFNP